MVILQENGKLKQGNENLLMREKFNWLMIYCDIQSWRNEAVEKEESQSVEFCIDLYITMN